MNRSSLSECSDVKTVIKNIFMSVNCPRGQFYPDKDYGRTITENDGLEKDKLLSQIRLAVDELDGVYIANIDIDSNEAELHILINDEERQVNIVL